MVKVSILAVAMAASLSGAQGFTKADSGWVRIFNGVNFAGLYSRLYAAPVVRPVDTTAFGIIYPGTDSACLRVLTTTKRGEVGTDKTTYSHYRTRMEYKFDGTTASFNAGLLYGVDEGAIRMQNNWPRGFEFQMQESEPGSLYSIQQVTATTRTSGGGYNATGTVVQVCEIGCNARSYKGNPVIPSVANGVSKWMRIELIQRGSDSAIHIVNDTVVFRLSNIRIFNDSTKKTGGSTTSGGATLSNFTPNGLYPSGALAVEGEGALINHRRWEVMEFPASTPMNEHFLHRLALDNPKQAVKPAGGSAVVIQWRGIGTIAKVKLQYKVGVAGAWLTITDSTANTGSYNWTAPTSVPDSLRVRISSYDYVIADSTGSAAFTGYNPTSVQAPIAKQIGSIAFARDGGGVTFSRVGNFKQLEVNDVFGKQIRILAVKGENLRWDLTDLKGARVPKGLYFVRLSGSGASKTLRVPVL